jgi:capsular exopolysaccharide synthesis family protein
MHRPKSSIAEGFRSIRSNLEFLFEKSKQQGKAIVFTSSISGEGKTFCAKNLATIYALSGKKTVLIGADMRKPKLYVDFDTENKKGLSTYLIGEEKLQDIIKKSAIENLSVITSGPVPPNPAELLGRGVMQLMISELREQFDYIILDSPPVGLVSDPVIIMELADLSVYVVRQGYTHQSFLNYVNDFHDSGKLENITILLNEVKHGGVYGYGYGYGSYGYGEYSGHGYYEEDAIEESFSIKNLFKKS